jgi:RNA-directed DNA polymerase
MDNLFQKIISLDNLCDSWEEYKGGKRKKEDVQVFERNLEDNLFLLHSELEDGTYRHSNYTSFYITDPKLRHIHKAVVRDRIVHHAIYRILYQIFDKSFIFDSYSCRIGKGTHRAVKRLEIFSRKASKNNATTCYCLKCDIRKFFDSIDHETIKELIRAKVSEPDTLKLVDSIIDSFNKTPKSAVTPENQITLDFANPKGMPIGNLTSQLFANIYLNPLDYFAKHKLRLKYYIRYCDDFVILDEDREKLVRIKGQIDAFLKSKLKLNLHDQKVSIRKLRQGIDFLGYVVLPSVTVLRTKTKRRMLQRVCELNKSSYLGLISHCDGFELEQKIEDIVEHQKEAKKKGMPLF